jgi:uncharacterized membrane protein
MRPHIAIFLAAAVLVTYIVLVVGLYVWQFGGPLFSTETGVWGQFGDYIGGLLNPLFALVNVGVIVYLALSVQRLNEAQRDSRQESERRIQAVIDLHREWNSETVYRSRTSAGKLVRRFPESSYFEIEDLVQYEEGSDIWVVVGFFQRLDFLTRHDKVQTEMVRDLFGELFVWWWVVSFATQLDRCDCDARTQMIILRDWFYAKTTQEQRAPWLQRANRDLSVARKNADFPLPVIV